MGDETKGDPGLPIKLEPCSNTEYLPLPMSDVVKETIRRARIACDENARRLGMPRREFLMSSMGAATTLAVLAACSSESTSDGSAGSSDGTTGPGGTYDVPDEATIDVDAALETLGSDQPVIDVQTHLLEYPPDMEEAGLVASLFASFRDDCTTEEANECFRTDRWIEEVFARSDTTMAVISAVPHLVGGDDPLSAEVMDEARRQLEEVCGGEQRVLVQGHGQPNLGELEEFFGIMEDEANRYELSAWKSYTHIGPGWSLDDSRGEPVGEAYLNRIEEMHADGLGPNILCVHKGFPQVGTADPSFALAPDVGPAAVAHPDLRFCIYHSGFNPDVAEGAYDPDNPNEGIDTLIKSLEDAEIGPGENVYAELGTTWRTVMGDPDQAAHVLGKLLVAFGEDRILWGTDSIWYGSPQDQIQALRAFEITPEFQDRFGYPELTEEIKHKIFWRNAADLHGIETYKLTCEPSQEAREAARRVSPLANRTYGPKTARMSRRMFFAAHPWASPH